MSRRSVVAKFALLLASVSGCATNDTNTPTPSPTSTTPESPTLPTAAVTPEAGPGELDGGERPPLGRPVRRLPLDTLQAAMTRVAGTDVVGKPLEWKVGGVNGFSDAAFGKALGRPDFRASTDENGVSSALYLKFVGDAARDLCMQMAKNDTLRDDPTERALFPKTDHGGVATEEQETANLRYLVLRFLGLRVGAGDPMIAGLREVFHAGRDSAVAAGNELSPSAEGWRGVCVTLFESPLFHND